MLAIVPADILIQITLWLSPADVISFVTVCRVFHDLSLHRSFWISYLECHRATTPFPFPIYADLSTCSLQSLRGHVLHAAQSNSKLSSSSCLRLRLTRGIALCSAWNILIAVPGTSYIVLRSEQDGKLHCFDVTSQVPLCSVAIPGATPKSNAYVTSCKYEEPGKCYAAIVLVDDILPRQDLLAVLCLDYGIPRPSLSVVLSHRYPDVDVFFSVALGPDVVAFTQPSPDNANVVTRTAISTGQTRKASLTLPNEVRTQMLLQGQDLYLVCHCLDCVRLYCWPESDSEWQLVGQPWYYDSPFTVETLYAMDIFTYPPTKTLVAMRPLDSAKELVSFWEIPHSSQTDLTYRPAPRNFAVLDWKTHFNQSSLVMASSDLTMFLTTVIEEGNDNLSLKLIRFKLHPQFSSSIYNLEVPATVNLQNITDLTVDERRGIVLLMSRLGVIYQLSYV